MHLSVKGKTFDLSLKSFSGATHFITHGIANITNEIFSQIVSFFNLQLFKNSTYISFFTTLIPRLNMTSSEKLS